MSPRIRNPRPAPPKSPRPGDQLDLDQRCVACRCGSHRNCRSATCTCADPSHETPSDASKPRPAPVTPGTTPQAPQGRVSGQESTSTTDDTHRETT